MSILTFPASGPDEYDGVTSSATVSVADTFEDGSLVIQDSTLDANVGGTTNLRVKLGTRPSSDVVVAASESSAAISISPSSRTFTQANWDSYQSFTVTGVQGGTGAISLAASGPDEYDDATGSATITVPFEDGSLVIQDDTLDVAGGGTVDLRVKLGAQPESNPCGGSE